MTTRITFRPVTERDLPLIHRWLREPAVKEWWYPEWALTFADVVGKFGRRISGDSPVSPWIVLADERPIGYIQEYSIAAYEDYAADMGAEPGWVGIDFYIGEPDCIGKGMGPILLDRFVVDVIFADPRATACVSGPDPANTRSIGALSSAGFEPLTVVSNRQDGGSEQVMIRRRRPGE